jgi:uncharacterized BrkB/YihY/UPF0761 family membrane protein
MAEQPQPSEGIDVTDVDPVAESALSDSSGLRALIERSRDRVQAGQTRVNELLEKHHDRPLLDIGLRIYQRDREAAGTIIGSALAFRLFLFFVPMLLFLVGVLGFIAEWIEADDVNETVGLSGTLAQQINTALSQPNTTRWIATAAGLFGMAWAGRSLSKVMVSASCLAWRIPVTTKASVRVIGSVVALVAGMGVVWTAVNKVRADFGFGAASLSFVAVVAIYGLAWMAMSMVLPRATRDPSALLPGAVLVGALLAGMQAFAQLYLPDKLGRASVLYGAIGTTVVTLGWFFFLGRAMVFGMSLDAVIYERFGSISQFVFGLPVVRVLPRKSAWIRRFFDLEPEADGSDPVSDQSPAEVPRSPN